MKKQATRNNMKNYKHLAIIYTVKMILIAIVEKNFLMLYRFFATKKNVNL